MSLEASACRSSQPRERVEKVVSGGALVRGRAGGGRAAISAEGLALHAADDQLQSFSQALAFDRRRQPRHLVVRATANLPPHPRPGPSVRSAASSTRHADRVVTWGLSVRPRPTSDRSVDEVTKTGIDEYNSLSAAKIAGLGWSATMAGFQADAIAVTASGPSTSPTTRGTASATARCLPSSSRTAMRMSFRSPRRCVTPCPQSGARVRLKSLYPAPRPAHGTDLSSVSEQRGTTALHYPSDGRGRWLSPSSSTRRRWRATYRTQTAYVVEGRLRRAPAGRRWGSACGPLPSTGDRGHLLRPPCAAACGEQLDCELARGRHRPVLLFRRSKPPLFPRIARATRSSISRLREPPSSGQRVMTSREHIDASNSVQHIHRFVDAARPKATTESLSVRDEHDSEGASTLGLTAAADRTSGSR